MEHLDALLVLTTWPAAADARAFATTLVNERLAACVNILPEMESVYRWQGAVERERERQVIIKTTGRRLEALKQRVRALHPYEVPELIAVPITGGGEPYLAWLAESTTPGESA
jgi:periplasmic divalent cation tolerance protein